MASNIDATKPAAGFASTANVRANFAAAKEEIEALQAGIASGIDLTFESAITDTDQGAGKVWFDSATLASVTVLYIDDASRGGIDINAWCDALDDSDSTIRGTLIVTLDNAPAQYQVFQVTGAVTSASTYTKIPVSYVGGHADNFDDGDEVHVQFARTGDKGSTGNTGPIGPETGIPLTIDLASQADSDPGAGQIRYNNATIASVTVIFVDDVDSDANDIQAQVNAWDDSDSAVRGHLKVVQDADPANYHLFAITGTNNDPGGYTKVTVTHVETGGTISDNDAVYVQFTRTGDKGDQGDPGTLTNVVEDTTPQLGGNLDLNGNDIVDSNGNEEIVFTETASAVNHLGVKNNVTTAAPELQALGDDTNIDLNMVPKGSGVLQQGGTPVALTGLHTIYVPAAAMRPTSSNGCATITDVETTAGRPDLQVLDFDATADEHAQFQVAFPKSWDEGTVTFRVFWTSTATDTDGVTWGLQGVACADGDTIDVAYGTAVVVGDLNQSTAEDLYVTDTSSAVTIAGTPAAGEICFFRVFRDVSDANDTAAEDARLIGLQLFFSTDAGNDA